MTWTRGGINASKLGSTNNQYLDTEAGINRVAIRSTLTPGTITVTATREGLAPASVTLASRPVEIVRGLIGLRTPGSGLRDGIAR